MAWPAMKSRKKRAQQICFDQRQSKRKTSNSPDAIIGRSLLRALNQIIHPETPCRGIQKQSRDLKVPALKILVEFELQSIRPARLEVDPELRLPCPRCVALTWGC